MRRMLLLVTVAATMAATMALAGPAFAAHEHYLVTLGTCVGDIASGQTSQTSGGGYHKFHENVHKGPSGDPATPGEFAFQNESNPVSVGKGACPPPA